jgi:hypothetical protein
VYANHRGDVGAPEFLFGAGKTVVFVRYRLPFIVPAQQQRRYPEFFRALVLA